MVVSLVYKNFPHRQMHHSYTRIAGLGMSALGQTRKSVTTTGMSALRGEPDVIWPKPDIETSPKSHADPSFNASKRQRDA